MLHIVELGRPLEHAALQILKNIGDSLTAKITHIGAFEPLDLVNEYKDKDKCIHILQYDHDDTSAFVSGMNELAKKIEGDLGILCNNYRPNNNQYQEAFWHVYKYPVYHDCFKPGDVILLIEAKVPGPFEIEPDYYRIDIYDCKHEE